MYKLDEFSKVKILVIGDVMVDKYLWGDVRRISPEAPVPVINLKRTDFHAGGAANVAANIEGLGAKSFLVGIVGDDSDGELFIEILKKAKVSTDYIIKTKNRPTTVKTRIVAHNQQVARIDQEVVRQLDSVEEELIWQKISNIADEIDVIVVSDYAKGIISENLMIGLITFCKEKRKKLLVDPKGKDYSKYKNATLLTPNKFELAEITNCHTETEEKIFEAGKSLVSKLNLEAIIVTRGEEGMTLIENGKVAITIKSVGRKVYDVTGAGDTFISTLAVSIGAGENYSRAARIANAAAGLVVEEVGTSIIKINSLMEKLKLIDQETDS